VQVALELAHKVVLVVPHLLVYCLQVAEVVEQILIFQLTFQQ
jgi:hypothetical protein